MIFLVQFGINKHSQIFQRLQIALALRLVQFFVVFEKFACAYLFQIALEIIWLPIQIAPLWANHIARVTSDFKMDVINQVSNLLNSNVQFKEKY